MNTLITRVVIFGIAIFAHSVQTSAAEWSPEQEEIVRATAEPLKSQPPEAIARYFAHPYPLASEGAAAALAANGETALPVVTQLALDRHPPRRGGAIRTLVRMLPKIGRGQGRQPMSPAMLAAVNAAIDALDQPEIEPTTEYADFADRLGHDDPLARRIAIHMAGSPDPAVRNVALVLTMDRIADAETRALVAKNVLTRSEGNVVRHYARAGKVAMGAKDAGRICLPLVADYLSELAHSQRGMFSDAAMLTWFNVIQLHAEHPDALASVRGIVRCVLRLPDGSHKGWVRADDAAMQALKAIGPDASALIRQTVRDEMKSVADMPQNELSRLSTSVDRIKNQGKRLEALAGEIDAKNPKQ